MKDAIVTLVMSLVVLAAPARAAADQPSTLTDGGSQSLVIAIPVDYEGQLAGAAVLAESIRTFGGSLSDVPIRIYLPERLHAAAAAFHERVTRFAVDIIEVRVPDVESRYILGAKPYAAARAEADTEGEFDLLAVLAPNTIVLAEPRDLLVSRDIKLGFSPVHHQNIGSPYDQPPDEFWSRLYEVLDVPVSDAFPIVSLADRRTLRFYFNAGSFVVRPKAGLLRAWADNFTTLATDQSVADMCREGPRNVFLHQAALAATAVKVLEQQETARLPDGYSYPLFFERFFGGDSTFDSLEGVVTMRYEFRLDDLPSGWQEQVPAPEGVIPWIESHLAGS